MGTIVGAEWEPGPTGVLITNRYEDRDYHGTLVVDDADGLSGRPGR